MSESWFGYYEAIDLAAKKEALLAAEIRDKEQWVQRAAELSRRAALGLAVAEAVIKATATSFHNFLGAERISLSRESWATITIAAHTCLDAHAKIGGGHPK